MNLKPKLNRPEGWHRKSFGTLALQTFTIYFLTYPQIMTAQNLKTSLGILLQRSTKPLSYQHALTFIRNFFFFLRYRVSLAQAGLKSLCSWGWPWIDLAASLSSKWWNCTLAHHSTAQLAYAVLGNLGLSTCWICKHSPNWAMASTSGIETFVGIRDEYSWATIC